MLTKQERKAIAERVVSFNGDTLRYVDFYKCLLGEYPQDSSSSFEDDKAILDRILDLCDTSNMVELPLDKDGEVIHVGDIVYYGSTIYMVKKIIYKGNEWEIQFFDDKLCISIYAEPNDLTRKKPVTIASLVEQIRDILDDDDDIAAWTFSRLAHIADQLESLGDSDD